MQTVSRFAFAVGMFLLVFVTGTGAATVPVTIRVGPELFEVQAEKATLSEILAALSAETGLKVVMQGGEGEAKSYAVKTQSLEQGLAQLLSDRNYVLFRRVGKVGAPPLLNLWVYDKNSERQFFEIEKERKPHQLVNNTGEHGEQIAKGPITESPGDEIPEGGGLQITEIENDSFLESLGFAQGDFIKNVNGSPIRSVSDLLQIIEDAQEKKSILRIERYNKDHFIDPIYIEPGNSH